MNTRIYAAGGAGINIAQRLVVGLGQEVVYVDTSSANKIERADEGCVHRIEGLDGSGKNRRLNQKPISGEIPKIMDKWPGADFNIVLFSSGGG